MKSCSWVNTKGRNIGSTCSKMAYDGNKYCAAHITVDMLNKNKEKRAQAEREKEVVFEEPNDSSEEDYEEVRTPVSSPVILPVPAVAHPNNREERVLSILEGMMALLVQLKLS